MLDCLSPAPIRLSRDAPPQLLVIVDTEEEFDWSKPVSRSSVGVTSIAAQYRAQDVFARHGIVPTYVIDYPVAATPASVNQLRRFVDAGACEIGAHLHPWVSPPFDEDVNSFHSYPGNLPAGLERAKLERLTDTIETNFGRRPTVYKAGRYGIGCNTAGILEALGYDVDVSVVPFTDFSADGGPDFMNCGDSLRWFGERRRMLEVPLSVGFAGLAAGLGPTLFPIAIKPMCLRLHVPGVLARSRLLERIRLTPEGVDYSALQRLTRSLLRQGQRIFSFTYHSPSLEPGHTPYVRSDADLSDFIACIERYCDWFVNELGGVPSTPAQLYAELSAAADQAVAA